MGQDEEGPCRDLLASVVTEAVVVGERRAGR